MTFSTAVQEAGQCWHERIGRHLCEQPWDKSLNASYASRILKIKKNAKVKVPTLMLVRIGGCRTSAIMIDPQEAIILDRIDLTKISKTAEDANFKYGESVLGENLVSKAQINWALDEARTYPFLLVRPGMASAMNSLIMTRTPDQHIVCVPGASFTYDSRKVRAARDFILAGNLQKKWRKAAALRQAISLGEHVGTSRGNTLLAQHALMLEEIPLDVWLPEIGSGDEIALGDCTAEKPAVDLSVLPCASTLIGKPQSTPALQPQTPDTGVI